jgi:hypothetical protein
MDDPVRRARAAAVPAFLTAGALLVAVWGTWPMALHLGTHVYDPAQSHGIGAWAIRPDIYLTIWILAWDVHALTTAPAELLRANIFHPSPASLLQMDHMLGALPLYFPLALLAGDPLLAHQAMLVLTFACAFLAAAALVRDWTGSWVAAILAGALFAFSPFRQMQLGAANLEGNYYLPLIVLCARRAVDDPRRRWPLLLALTLIMQALDSYQVGYAAFAGTGALCATVLACNAGARRRWSRLIAPVLGAAAIVGLSAVPYLAVARGGNLPVHSLAFVRGSSALPGDFGAGGLAVALAVASVPFWRVGVRAGLGRCWPAALVVVAMCTHLLALGPEITVWGHTFPGPWAWVGSVVPGFNTIRVPARFVSVASMAVSALAAVGVAGAMHWWSRGCAKRSPWLRWLLPAAAVAVAVVSVHRFMGGQPLALRPVETRHSVPPVYRWLATAPPGGVVELPLRNWDVFLDRETEALRMYRSIYHWQPIVNGYSGHPPLSYRLMAAIAARLPDPTAVHDIAQYGGVRYVVVPASDEQWQRSTLPRTVFDEQAVYSLDPVMTGDVAPIGLPLDRWHGRTPGGVALAPLPAAAQHAMLSEPQLPKPMAAGFPQAASVLLENRSATAWPGIALPGSGGVALSYQIRDAAGQPLVNAAVPTPLGVDVNAGERVRVPLWFWTAPQPGQYRLHIFLIQDGVGPFDPSLGGTLTIPIETIPFSM